MGMIIRFPDEKRLAWTGGSHPKRAEAASVVILPVIRIERHLDETEVATAPELDSPGRGRKRPARRS
jgi:hypothetical protein